MPQHSEAQVGVSLLLGLSLVSLEGPVTGAFGPGVPDTGVSCLAGKEVNEGAA